MDNTKPKVLYVDDEHFNLTAFTAAFRRYYTILTASSGIEAVKILQENKGHVSVIITDQRMPEMTGVQFLEAVIPEYPEPARMILTAFSDIDAITKAINTGQVLRYITKPWNETELKQIIDMGVKIHELEQNNQVLMGKLEEELTKQKKTLEFFQMYVPENIIKQSLLLNQDTTLSSGEFRIITTLFSDIRDFTKFCETIDPKKLVTYLNEYFSIMVNCVIKNHGTIYKLIGDGLLAIFGWPVSSIHNQLNAVRCALDMKRALESFNESLGNELQHETQIGIGISTGEASVGRIEAEHSMSYIAIGKSVDATFAIEEMTRNLPNSILISEATYRAVKDHIEAEEMKFETCPGVEGHLFRVIGKLNGQ